MKSAILYLKEDSYDDDCDAHDADDYDAAFDDDDEAYDADDVGDADDSDDAAAADDDDCLHVVVF